MCHTINMKNETTMTAATETFNGWANFETYNVALWLQNNYSHYKIARQYDRYDALIPRLELNFGQMTPDGVRWMDGLIDTNELDEMLADL